MKIIIKNGTGEITEKKSKFIANVFSINNEGEAQEILTAVKKKYWDARHNCYAYVCGQGNEIQKFSDDGEPSQTAGKPIMEVITGEGIHNCLIVVTRYFGGTLLGTGGLIRAYTEASKEGIANSIIKDTIIGKKIDVELDYNSLGKIQYICGQMEVKIIETVYDQNVHIKLAVPDSQMGSFSSKITDAFSGNIVFDNAESIEFYCKENGNVEIVG